MKSHQLQRAKANLSRIVEEVQVDGPAVITVHGRAKAVLISKRDYDQKVGRGGSLMRFLRASPLRGVELDLVRDQSLGRKVDI